MVLRRYYTDKASGHDGIRAELFQILKDDAVGAACNMPENLENSAVATGLEKISFHSSPKEIMQKNVQIIIHLHLFHMLPKLYSKSFKLGFSSM